MRLVLALLMLLIAQPALALSCMRPDVVRAFEAANASSDTHYIFRGKFDVLTLRGAAKAEGGPLLVGGLLRGKTLDKGGFVHPVDTRVDLSLTCAASWCAEVKSADDAIVVVRKEGSRLIVDVSPCGGTIFVDPTPSDVSALTQCMQGRCPAGRRR